eukprot:863683-Rhodomonas_salina.1
MANTPVSGIQVMQETQDAFNAFLESFRAGTDGNEGAGPAAGADSQQNAQLKQPTAEYATAALVTSHEVARRMAGLPVPQSMLICGQPPTRRKKLGWNTFICEETIETVTGQINLIKLTVILLMTMCTSMAKLTRVPRTTEPGPRAALETYSWTLIIMTNAVVLIDRAWRTRDHASIKMMLHIMLWLQRGLIAAVPRGKSLREMQLNNNSVSKLAPQVVQLGEAINEAIESTFGYQIRGGPEEPDADQVQDGSPERLPQHAPQDKEDDDAASEAENSEDSVQSRKKKKKGKAKKKK